MDLRRPAESQHFLIHADNLSAIIFSVPNCWRYEPLDQMVESAATLLEHVGQAAQAHPGQAMLLLAAGTLVSEDLACITAGLLAAAAKLSMPHGIIACATGIWVGDLALYGLGAAVRHGSDRWAWLARWVKPSHLQAGERHFQKHGTASLAASRFLPGTRLPGYLAAAASGYPFLRFAFILALGTLLWVPLLCFAAQRIGTSVLGMLDQAKVWLWVAVPALWLTVHSMGRLATSVFTWRCRRLWWCRWLRFSRWEFWPTWVLYPPVVLWTMLLALRHRSAKAFMLCNPGISFSGLVMESKTAILTALARDNPNATAIAPWTPLPFGPPEQRLAALDHFLEQHSISWPGPVVLKPDVGERGLGVMIVRSRSEAASYLSSCAHPVLAQRFFSGREFGVFYCRQPGEKKGHILSLAEKHLHSLMGDGIHTLETLILSHPRAVAMAPYYLKKFSADLHTVPAQGEQIALTEIGTHYRGAVFTDARAELTPALTDAIDALTQPFTGFHFGRYDLRVPDITALRERRDLPVLELNGVTAEPAHIYQPGYPLWRGWRDLCGTWSEAFAAGAAQSRGGKVPPSLNAVCNLLLTSRRHQRFVANTLPPSPARPV